MRAAMNYRGLDEQPDGGQEKAITDQNHRL